mgnify:CR=1 FL=1
MATRVDLNGIKEAIQNILTDANTTTASPIDLSYGLAGSKRVQQILKTHPAMIRPQASFFPLVTCFINEKTSSSETIKGGQLLNQRRATIEVSVLGSIWNSNIASVDEDPADEDISQLMENIELILRSDATLRGKVNWQRPSGCKYYTELLNQQTHLRSGVLTFNCEVFY